MPENFANKQSLTDWVYQVVATVQPPGKCFPHLVERKRKDSLIKEGHGVLVVAFPPSPLAPHQAPDTKYYIRAGAHSRGAQHFLVEAIRARRFFQQPQLRALLRMSIVKPDIVEFVVTAINDNPALEVELDFNPLPKFFKEHFEEKFPLRIPVISSLFPFTMEFYYFGLRSEYIDPTSFELRLKFQDGLGNSYEHIQVLDVTRNIGPLSISSDRDDIGRHLQIISREIEKVRRLLEQNSESPKNNNQRSL